MTGIRRVRRAGVAGGAERRREAEASGEQSLGKELDWEVGFFRKFATLGNLPFKFLQFHLW